MPPCMLPRCSDHEFDQIFRFGCTWSSFRRIHAPMRCLRTVLPCQLQNIPEIPRPFKRPSISEPKVLSLAHLSVLTSSPSIVWWCMMYTYYICILYAFLNQNLRKAPTVSISILSATPARPMSSRRHGSRSFLPRQLVFTSPCHGLATTERPEPTMAVAFFPFQTLKPPVSASSLLAPNGPNVSYYFVERLGCSQLHSKANIFSQFFPFCHAFSNSFLLWAFIPP